MTIDLKKSLACQLGGNPLIKKKKEAGYLSWYELMENVFDSLLNKSIISERVANITLYHGTALSNFPSIYEYGLEANQPQPGAVRGVYLTPDKDLAARYAMTASGNPSKVDITKDGKIPMVLKLVISKPRRIKDMIYDPLDRTDSKYEEYDMNGEEPQSYLAGELEDILRSVEKAAGLPERPKYDNKFHDLISVDLDDFEGVSLYELIMNLGMATPWKEKLDIPRKTIIDIVNKMTKPGQEFASGMLELSNSRTLHRTEGYYTSREQLVTQGKEVSGATIKAVFIPKEHVPDLIGEIEKIAPKMIPGEIRHLYDRRQLFFQKYYYDFRHKDEVGIEDLEKMLETIETEELYFDELAQIISRAIESYDNLEGDDFSDAIDAIIEEMDIAENIMHEDFLNDDLPFTPAGEWVKVDPKVALKVAEEIDKHN